MNRLVLLALILSTATVMALPESNKPWGIVT